MWQSPDPILDEYMDGQTNGGVFNPKNLNLFTYTYNNPVNLVDPDGNNPKLLLDFGINLAIAYATEGKLNWSAVKGAAVDTVTDAFNPTAQFRKAEKLAKIVKHSVGELRSLGRKDAHHIIQDAAAKKLPGYNTNAAPGVQLQGPANKKGTPHYKATQVQRQKGTGTYASERRIGYKALRKAGFSKEEARTQIGHADEYFKGLGVTADTKMRPVRNRRN